MTRREYLYFQFSTAITFLIASCKPDEKDKPQVISVPEKKLSLLNIVPDKAIAGSTLEVFWFAENIETLSVLTKIGNANWELVADAIDSKSNSYKIQLPLVFEKDEPFAIKLLGGGLEAIRENIITEYTPPPVKTIEILKIEPEEAIAEEKLKVFFKAENIKTVLIELRSINGDLLEIRNVEAVAGLYELSMSDKFETDDLLSIKISGDAIFAIKEKILTFNVLKINTDDYRELKTNGGFQKLSLTKGDIWLKRVATNEMKAFSGQCTHAGCGIDFLKSDNLFYCSCHGSKFSSDGLVLNGPASSPLNQYNCKFVKDGVFELIY